MSAELEQVTLAVAAINKVEAGLAALRQEYGGVVYEVTTTAGMELAKKARSDIREPRYEVERIRKAAKAPILALGKKLDSEAARITAELEKIEGPIHQQIVAEEQRKEREKQARIDAEIARVAEIQRLIDGIRQWPVNAANQPSMLVGQMLQQARDYRIEETVFQEFCPAATQALQVSTAALAGLLIDRQSHEAKEAQLERDRQELARLRADEDERQRIAAAERADNERIARERQADLDRQAAAQRQAQAAEEQRLADQRAEVAREHEALRISRLPPAKKPKHNPGSEALTDVIATHYGVEPDVARRWLREIDWEMVSA